MKDLSKRFINIHAGLSPLASVEASKGVLVDQSHQVQQVGGVMLATSCFLKLLLKSKYPMPWVCYAFGIVFV